MRTQQMRCPHDSTDLIITERQGIEFHYCPARDGGWLDAVELNEVFDRAAAGGGSGPDSLVVLGEMDARPRRRRGRYSRAGCDGAVYDRQRKGKKRRGRGGASEDMLEY